MTTIRPCTTADATVVAALWNAKIADTASCWSQAPATTASHVSSMIESGLTFFLAEDDGLPAGFGFCSLRGDVAQLVALAADDVAVYYALMAAYCQWGLGQGVTVGRADLGVAPTTERVRMDALGVIQYTPIGFAPLMPAQSEAERQPLWLKAECDLQTLADRLAEVLA